MKRLLLSAAFFAACILPGWTEDAAAPAGNYAHLSRLEEGDKPGSHLFSQNGIDLNPEASYRLTFWAKASTPLVMRVLTKFDQPPWKGLQDKRVELGTEWQQHEVILSGAGAEPGHTRLEFRYAGPEPGEIWLADVQLQPEGEADAKNMIVNGRFEEKLTNWYTEGQRPGIFVVDVQTPQEAAPATP